MLTSAVEYTIVNKYLLMETHYIIPYLYHKMHFVCNYIISLQLKELPSPPSPIDVSNWVDHLTVSVL
jgi:hypothetical protein